MTVKICFNNQTHRITKNPVDFTSLLQKVVEIFGSQLPQNWTLQYLDSDDDKIMLNSQEDYKALIEEEIGTSSKSAKIFVLALGENQSNADLSSMIESQKKENAVEKPVIMLEDAENTYILEAQDQDLVKENKNEEVAQAQEEPAIVEEKVLSEAVIEEEQPKIEALVQPEPEPEHKEMFCKGRILKVLSPEYLQQVQERKQQLKAKQHKFKQLIAEKKAEKKNEFRDAVTDIIFEQLPVIASLTKEFIQDNKTEQVPRVEENTSVHRCVRCDGCGVFPIVGIRYKCYVCPNFDFCEKCEATKEHDHPFIKFKQPQGKWGHGIRSRVPCFGRMPEPQPEIKTLPFKIIKCSNKINETVVSQPVKPEEVVEPVVEKVEDVVIEEVKPEPEEIKKEEVVIEEIKEEKKEYDTKTREKTEKLKEMFGDLDLENVLEFVSQVPDLSLEELVDCYKQF